MNNFRRLVKPAMRRFQTSRAEVQATQTSQFQVPTLPKQEEDALLEIDIILGTFTQDIVFERQIGYARPLDHFDTNFKEVNTHFTPVIQEFSLIQPANMSFLTNAIKENLLNAQKFLNENNQTEAKNLLKNSLKIKNKSLLNNDDNILIAEACEKLAWMAEKEKDMKEASKLYKKAVKLLEKNEEFAINNNKDLISRVYNGASRVFFFERNYKKCIQTSKKILNVWANENKEGRIYVDAAVEMIIMAEECAKSN